MPQRATMLPCHDRCTVYRRRSRPIQVALPLVLFVLANLWPVRFALLDEPSGVGAPLLQDLRVEVQVQLAVHDLERAGIDVELVAHRDPERAVAAVLRRELGGVRGEGVAVRGGGKEVSPAAVLCGELLIAGDRFSFGEVGDRVVTVKDDTGR